MSEGAFAGSVIGSIVVLFAVAFGLFDFEGPAADLCAVATLATGWLALDIHEPGS